MHGNDGSGRTSDTRLEPKNSEVIKVDIDLLGMEARSIFKSIRTENTKLLQADRSARSDLSYFKARHNYYKLSILRLDPIERQILEPVLAKFRRHIQDWEMGIQVQTPPTPFLAAVEQAVTPVPESSDEADLNLTAVPVTRSELAKPKSETSATALRSEIELIQVALSAEASNERNQVIRSALDRIKERL
jgi:hypothetical protein